MSRPTAAILGASADRAKFGNKSLRAHAAQGYDVYAVNINGGVVEGERAWRTLAEVPVERLNRISVYLPPEVTLRVLDEIAAKGCDELWLNPGSDNPEVLRKAEALGLNAIRGCSIVSLGLTPSQFQ